MLDILELTQPVQDILQTYDYDKQNEQTKQILDSITLPLSSRYRIRPVYPEDIPSVSHILCHVFGEEGTFGKYLGFAKLFQQIIDFWTARSRVMLLDHLCFVIEDLEYKPEEHEDIDFPDCECHKFCKHHSAADLKARHNVAAIITGHDLASYVGDFGYLVPMISPLQHVIPNVLKHLGSNRMQRIREEDNLLLTKKQEEEKVEAEKSKPPYVFPTTFPAIITPSNDPFHNYTPRTSPLENMRTQPLPLEGAELFLLATRRSYYKQNLALAASIFFKEYVKRFTPYQYLTMDAGHPATEKIWVGQLGGRVMSRVKITEFEYENEKGEKIRPFAALGWDYSTIDVILKC